MQEKELNCIHDSILALMIQSQDMAALEINSNLQNSRRTWITIVLGYRVILEFYLVVNVLYAVMRLR